MVTIDSAQDGVVRSGSILSFDKRLYETTRGLENLEHLPIRFLAVNPHQGTVRAGVGRQNLWDGYLIVHPLASPHLLDVTIPLDIRAPSDWRLLVSCPTTVDVTLGVIREPLNGQQVTELIVRASAFNGRSTYITGGNSLLSAYRSLAIAMKVKARWRGEADFMAAFDEERTEHESNDAIGTSEVVPGSVVQFKEDHFAKCFHALLIDRLPFRFLALEKMGTTEKLGADHRVWLGFLIAPPVAKGTMSGRTLSMYGLLRLEAMRDWTIIASRLSAIDVSGCEVLGQLSTKSLELAQAAIRQRGAGKRGLSTAYPRLAVFLRVFTLLGQEGPPD